MSLTTIVSNVFKPRQKELEKYVYDAEHLQHKVLMHLINKGKNTEYGVKHLLNTTNSYDKFAQNIPVNTYEELKGDIDRMRHGEKDILWPGLVKWYAKSSGTTNDKSKFIPVSHDGLHGIHYAGGFDAVAYYLRNNPKSRLFDGKSLILGGSHSPNYNVSDSLVGDLSAILIENINPLANLVRVPKKSTALLSDFEVKRDLIARETMNKNVTNISGVPSWMLSVLVRVMELSGKKHLEEVWPNLEVFFHGGIAFTPYRKQYEQLITSPNMHYMETYNASEGFFGLQDDPADPAMSLMIDYDVFYEFIPMDEFGSENPTVVPLWGVEVGKNYAMIITTSCGLWRYLIGDTVQFTSKNPYKFVITGRTKYFINAFGEELIMAKSDRLFARFDRDRDGRLSKAEFTELSKAFFFSGVTRRTGAYIGGEESMLCSAWPRSNRRFSPCRFMRTCEEQTSPSLARTPLGTRSIVSTCTERRPGVGCSGPRA